MAAEAISRRSPMASCYHGIGWKPGEMMTGAGRRASVTLKGAPSVNSESNVCQPPLGKGVPGGAHPPGKRWSYSRLMASRLGAVKLPVEDM